MLEGAAIFNKKSPSRSGLPSVPYLKHTLSLLKQFFNEEVGNSFRCDDIDVSINIFLFYKYSF